MDMGSKGFGGRARENVFWVFFTLIFGVFSTLVLSFGGVVEHGISAHGFLILVKELSL
jgi:hypothetical protein